MSDRGAQIESHWRKLFSQSAPTTALGLAITAATCEVYVQVVGTDPRKKAASLR